MITTTDPMAHLAQSDFFRLPTQLTTRPLPFKEWHHFVVQLPGLRFLVNFSLSLDEQPGGLRQLAPRVLVVSHGSTEASAHHRGDPQTTSIDPDLRGVRIDGSSMRIADDGYHLNLDLPDHGIRAQLLLRPTSRPFVVNNQPVGAGRLSWLFVPELVADGVVDFAGTVVSVDSAVAYHDHNWGHFRWGDDFSWMWGSVLPERSGDLSIVAMRMTDRAGHRTHAQALYAWRDREPVAIFRDAQITMRRSGSMAGPATSHLPPVVRMLTSDSTDVPASLDIVGADATNRIAVSFRADDYSRIGLPDEQTVDRVVTLDEATGPVNIRATLDTQSMSATAAGFFEFCHG